MMTEQERAALATLADYLEEAHQPELDTAHAGDAPRKGPAPKHCTYCAAIRDTRKLLAAKPAIDPRVLANKRETFGEVSWCDEDIREALRETKRPITPANIEAVRDSWYARHISDTMIEAGWENLYTAARELPEKAKRKGKRAPDPDAELDAAEDAEADARNDDARKA